MAAQSTMPRGARLRRPAAGRAPRRRRVLSAWPQYLAVSPFFLVFTGFALVPILFTLYLSFQKWDGIGSPAPAGLSQYRFLVHDHTFWLALSNTLIIWVLSTVPTLFIALVVAAMLNSTVRLTAFYRVAYFVPSVTSLVAIAIFFFAVFSSQFGLVNGLLHVVGVPAVPWMSNSWAIKIVISLLMTWQWVGYNAIIYLAGMQAIPAELYEAARVDGAGPVQSFFRITVPMLRPIILFTVVVSTVTGLQSFTEPQVMFGSTAAINPNSGGPGQAGLTVMLYFYHQAFDNNDFGYGAAISWVLFLVIMLLVAVNWRLVGGRER